LGSKMVASCPILELTGAGLSPVG